MVWCKPLSYFRVLVTIEIICWWHQIVQAHIVWNRLILQTDTNNRSDWTNRWLLKLNADKCKIPVASYGRNIKINANYTFKYSILGREESYKEDPGVKFDTKLKLDQHINEKINKVYNIFGIIKRNFRYTSVTKVVCYIT